MPLEPTEELTRRFFEKVDLGSSDECWEWEASTASRGYGYLGTNSNGEELAHRYMMKFIGYDIDEKQVNHRCDNPPCVNPNHLYVGTQKENMRDAVQRGDYPTGEDHHNAKLSDKQVEEIRERYSAGGTSQKNLANEYGINQSRVSRIVNGEREVV